MEPVDFILAPSVVNATTVNYSHDATHDATHKSTFVFCMLFVLNFFNGLFLEN